jgi:hypothetical protein
MHTPLVLYVRTGDADAIANTVRGEGRRYSSSQSCLLVSNPS